MHRLTPERRFAELVAADGSRPFVTYYDEATGERSELSRHSLANWVAKTRNLLGDELGLGLGDTATVTLPPHWITVPIVLGALAAGLAVDDGNDATDSDAAASGDTSLAAVGFAAAPDELGAEPDRYLVDVGRAAAGFGDAVPAGFEDYVSAVRPQGDTWASVSMPAVASDPGPGGVVRGESLARAADRAAELGLGDGGRLLVTGDTDPAWLHTVLVPLAVGGSVVIVRNATDDSVLERRAEQERVTARV